MVALLREFPDVRMTFNLVLSCWCSSKRSPEGAAIDSSVEPETGGGLTNDIAFILENFFHAQRHMIDAYPRYGELLAPRRRRAIRR
jgi:hypothetical protein